MTILKNINEQFDKLCNINLGKQYNLIKEYMEVGDTNTFPLQPLNEMTVDRLLGKHYNNGFIIISASRGENDNQTNNKLSKQLLNDIKNSGFSFVPVFGGFIENKGTENEKQVYETSYIVLNFDRNGNEKDFNTLKNLAINLCKKYNQDSVLVKAPNGVPQYITQNGNVDMEFNGDVKINDLTQQYFSSFIKTQNIDKNQDNRKHTRFTFESCFINPKPMTYNEGHIRHLKGEKFLTENII